METTHLFPVILPKTQHFHGPSLTLQSHSLFLTWAELKGNSMVYLNQTQRGFLSQAGLDVHEYSLKNLRASANKQFQTHLKKNERGTFMIAFMNDDGLGPSRLLLADKILEFFPQGYFVAVPERSCGIAMRSDLTVEEEKTMRDLVHGCFTQGTKPVQDGWVSPSELLPL